MGQVSAPEGEHNTETYDRIFDNAFLRVSDNPRSTFSIDVDTASYSNVRRFLNDGKLPPRDAVRIEELVNYFPYDYPQPQGEHPMAVTAEVAECPWNTRHQLVRIGVQGRRISQENMPPRNLVFLIDTSGSMHAVNKLPLLQASLRLLTEQLRAEDRLAIVAYAGSAGLVLDSTPGNQHDTIIAAISRLQAGGSTNGGAGIQLAYRVAVDNFIKGGVNRVILGTDGDFNVGATNDGDLVRLIEEKRQTGVYLSVLGFGMGNLKDSRMEKLAQHGNGQYGYIDTLAEARKAFVEDVAGLAPIARDVKLQIEFNPANVQAFRLIGYENRLLRTEDFNDDQKDAGDLGGGHAVTALYELAPPGVSIDLPKIDPLRYQKQESVPIPSAAELLMVNLRYLPPDGKSSSLLSVPLANTERSFAQATEDFRFAAAVASFGMILRDSAHKGSATLADVQSWAQAAQGADLGGYRREFVGLVQTAARLRR